MHLTGARRGIYGRFRVSDLLCNRLIEVIHCCEPSRPDVRRFRNPQYRGPMGRLLRHPIHARKPVPGCHPRRCGGARHSASRRRRLRHRRHVRSVPSYQNDPLVRCRRTTFVLMSDWPTDHQVPGPSPFGPSVKVARSCPIACSRMRGTSGRRQIAASPRSRPGQHLALTDGYQEGECSAEVESQTISWQRGIREKAALLRAVAAGPAFRDGRKSDP